jgi:hypothetical protein
MYKSGRVCDAEVGASAARVALVRAACEIHWQAAGRVRSEWRRTSSRWPRCESCALTLRLDRGGSSECAPSQSASSCSRRLCGCTSGPTKVDIWEVIALQRLSGEARDPKFLALSLSHDDAGGGASIFGGPRKRGRMHNTIE